VLVNTPNAKVLFVSEIEPLKSVRSDFTQMDNPCFELVTINYESLHKLFTDKKCTTVKDRYHIIIIDECHKIGSYPRPGVWAQRLKVICQNRAVIYLSATPTPESGSQIYHQMWVSSFTPFAKWPSFYIWAKEFVDITVDNIRGVPINNYDKADLKKILSYLSSFSITVGKDDGEDAALSEIEEKVFEIDVSKKCEETYKAMRLHKIVHGPNGLVSISNSGGELDNKLAQIASGTLRFAETVMGPCEPQAIVIDTSKADFIRSYFFGQKIAIIYRYIAEGDLLKKYFPNYTENYEEFNTRNDLVYIKHIRSARVGINLATADWIVMYNVEESSISYIQGMARGQSMYRKEPSKVAFIFSKLGIEHKIYKSVKSKNPNTDVHYA
jgi:hypothetical protein